MGTARFEKVTAEAVWLVVVSASDTNPNTRGKCAMQGGNQGDWCSSCVYDRSFSYLSNTSASHRSGEVDDLVHFPTDTHTNFWPPTRSTVRITGGSVNLVTHLGLSNIGKSIDAGQQLEPYGNLKMLVPVPLLNPHTIFPPVYGTSSSTGVCDSVMDIFPFSWKRSRQMYHVLARLHHVHLE